MYKHKYTINNGIFVIFTPDPYTTVVAMKKTLTIALTFVLSILAIVALYRCTLRKFIPDGVPISEQVVSILQQDNCYACHSADPQLPFYSKLPIIGPMMGGHVRHAQDFVVLEGESYEQPSEVLLSMLEYTAEHNNMPIQEYRMIHWGTRLSKAERRVLSEYVRQMRAEHYATGLSSDEHASEPVQVLPCSIPVDEARADLGKRMFNDTRISLDNTISCATCHILSIGGADEYDERTSKGIYDQAGGVNAPTVYNSVYNIQQFWNGRAADLKEQAAGPPENPVEMGDQTWAQIVDRLRTDRVLVAEFERLYPGEGLTQSSVTEAIAEYEKTLLTPNSRFDKYLAGQQDAISDAELAGYQAFKDNACATCHTGKVLGGQSFEKLGIYEDYYADRAQRCPDLEYVSDDDGLKSFTGRDEDLHRFKTPMLRNIAITPPYFHDGTYETLEDAVSAMYRFELGREPRPDDLSHIVSFLGTLTGEHRELVAK